MNSMTGFSRVEGKAGEFYADIQLRTVNHRSLDMNFRMARQVFPFENQFRKLIQKKINRGRIDISIYLRPGEKSLQNLTLDINRSDAAYGIFCEIIEKYNIDSNLSLSHFLKIDDLLIDSPTDIDENLLEKDLLNLLSQALAELTKMRVKEGLALKLQLEKNLNNIEKALGNFKKYIPEMREKADNQIKEKTEAFLKENPDLAEYRFQQEILFYLDKVDTEEEIIRLESHLKQAKELIEEKGPMGKKLDFIAQEMIREANTIASKSQDVVQTDTSIELKFEIEKMREQIMNIE